MDRKKKNPAIFEIAGFSVDLGCEDPQWKPPQTSPTYSVDRFKGWHQERCAPIDRPSGPKKQAWPG
jgi:hypothetical protein